MDWFTAGRRPSSSSLGSDYSAAAPSGVGEERDAGWSRFLTSQTARQEGRGLLWSALSLVVGLMVYYALNTQPPFTLSLVFGGLAFCIVAVKLFSKTGPISVLFAAMLAGFALGQVGTKLGGTTILPASTGKVQVTGWLEQTERRSEKRRRIVVAVDAISNVKPEFWPEKVRLSVSGENLGETERGALVVFDAWLYPPLTPALPGGWNFGRIGWFDGIGAGGRVAGPVIVSDKKPARAHWTDTLTHIRQTISQRIRQHLPEREAGFATALITGERAGLDKDTRSDLQISGLAHILAISGLHMSLVAGGVFWLVRSLLALWPAVALRWPIKKMAAVAGLGAAAFYLMISGQAIATQRAFIMLCVMFIAILLGRSAISMRNLAIAAIIVLLITPHAVLTASFQMSFLAVMGLIAGYEALSGKRAWFYDRLYQKSAFSRFVIKLFLGLAALSVTTIIASAFTALPAAYHFNRFAVWSLPANLLAMPVVSFVVMPSAVASVVAMPLGLEYWPLQVMQVGLRLVAGIAEMVAAWPGAASVIGSMQPVLVFLSVMGLAFLCLWRGSLRLAGGAVAIMFAVVSVMLGSRPDIYVERTAATMAARIDEAGLLVPVHKRKSRFAVEKWLLADGDGAKPSEAAKRVGWQCDGDICTATVKNRSLMWVGRDVKSPENCRDVDFVIAADPLRRACGFANDRKVRIDRFDVWRNGAHAIYVDEGGSFLVKTARQISGDRPWVLNPVARRKVLINPPVFENNRDRAQ